MAGERSAMDCARCAREYLRLHDSFSFVVLDIPKVHQEVGSRSHREASQQLNNTTHTYTRAQTRKLHKLFFSATSPKREKPPPRKQDGGGGRCKQNAGLVFTRSSRREMNLQQQKNKKTKQNTHTPKKKVVVFQLGCRSTFRPRAKRRRRRTLPPGPCELYMTPSDWAPDAAPPQPPPRKGGKKKEKKSGKRRRGREKNGVIKL